MDKIELIDRAAVIADLKTQFAAVYKDTMLRPIMDDDPFIEVLEKSEGRHMQLFLDGLEAYLMTRPTLDVHPVRRGEWAHGKRNGAYGIWCSRCGTGWGESPNYEVIAVCHNFCPNCGADMRGETHGTD